MAFRRFDNVLIFLAFACLAAFTPGCAESFDSEKAAKAIAAVNTCNIQRLTNLYSAFQMAHYGPGPQNEADFKQFITDVMGPAHLKLMQIDPDKIDALFISERDHKPFRVKYGVEGGPGVVNAVVFEEEGINGIRQVGFNGGTVQDVGQARYQDLWDSKSPARSEAAGPTGDPSSTDAS
jgi:hypothetical protein